MIRSLRFALFFAAAGYSLSGLADDLFVYSALEIPDLTAEKCEERAFEVADAITRSGGSIFKSRCTAATTPQYHNIEVQYVAPQAIEPVTTFKRHERLRLDGYADSATCSAQLGSEVQAFVHFTGLKPVISYCRRLQNSLTDQYVMVIDAFGIPRLNPFLIQEVMMGAPVVGYDAFAERIRRTIYSGIHISSVFYSKDLGNRVLNVRYYSKSVVPYYNEELIIFADRKSCLDVEPIVSEIARHFNPQPLVTYCSGGNFSRLFRLEAVKTVGPGSLRIERANFGFTSMTECQTELESIESLYRGPLRRQVHGAFCAVDVTGPSAYVATTDERVLEE